MSRPLVRGRPPVCQGDDVLSVSPGTLPRDELDAPAGGPDAAVIMKLGRNLAKVRARRERPASSADADYVERARWTTRARRCRCAEQARRPGALLRDGAGSRLQRRPMTDRSGRLTVVGLGTGRGRHLHARRAGAARPRPRPTLRLRALSRPAPCGRARRRHASDNREELGRAPAAALAAAAGGRRVRSFRGATRAFSPWRPRSARRSTTGRQAWRSVDLDIVPGVTAMLAVAGAVGAPLGHDFCAHLAFGQFEAVGRHRAAARSGRARPASCSRSTIRSAGRVPGSSARRSSFCADELPASTPVVFGRAAGRPDEAYPCRRSAEADAAWADMATLHHCRLAATRGSSSAASGRRWSIRRAHCRRRADDRPCDGLRHRARPRGMSGTSDAGRT